MQRMSRGRDQWQRNVRTLDCFNHVNDVSTRSKGQASLRSHTRSSTHADIEQGFLKKRVIFWRKFKWWFSLDTSFFVQCTLPPKKVQKGNLKHPYFLEIFFWLDKLKNEFTRQNPTKKEEKKNTTSANKNWKRQLKNRKDFLQTRKSRGDKKKLFFSENKFSKEIVAKINCKWKKKRW